MTTKEGGLRGGIRNVGVGTAAIPDSGNLQTWYDAADTSTLLSSGATVSDGDAIDEWQTKEGSINFTGGSPTRNDSGIGSNTVVDYDATDDQLTAGSTSDWTFLSDGSAFSLYLVTNTSATDELVAAVTTQGAPSSSNRGFAIERADRSGQSEDSELRVAVSDGSGWVFQTNITNEWPADSDEIFAVIHDPNATNEYKIYRGLTEIDSISASGQSTSDPEYPLTTGETQDFHPPYDGQHGEIPIYNVAHNTSTKDDVINYLSEKWGISV